MKKLISLLACAALLIGLVVAVFPAMTSSADTSIQAGGFSDAAPGTTTFKLGGANVGSAGDKAQLVVGEDNTYEYKLTQDLAAWVKTQVYAPDNKTVADVREFDYLYVNIVHFSDAAPCMDANGNYVDTSGRIVTDVKDAKMQDAFLADLIPQVSQGNDTKNIQRKKSDGSFENWDLLSPDIRSKSCVQISLADLKSQIVAQNKALTADERKNGKEIDVDAVLSNLTLNVLLYGQNVKLELYVSNNPDFDPTPVTVEKNPTVTLGASDDKGTVTKNDDGYYEVKAGKDQVINLFSTSGAGNINAANYPYLHVKFLLSSGAKVTSAVLIDNEGKEYKAGTSSAFNILGGEISGVSSRQITFDTSKMTAADKQQFLGNLRIKMTVEGGTVSLLAKVSTDGNIKITSDNVPGITTHKLTAKPGAGMPKNAEVVMDEATGSVNYNLGGHLAAWVPAALYNGDKAVNGNDYQYLIIDVKSMTSGLCRNDNDTAYATEVENADGTKTWKDVESEKDAKVQIGFAASFQLTYSKNGTSQQLKKVNLDKDGNMKKKTIREDSKELATTPHYDNEYEEVTVNVDGTQKVMKAYYVKGTDGGKYVVDGGDWGVAGEARQPMTHKVDFKKLAEQVKENNAALDKALKDKQISQAEHDAYTMDLQEVLKTLTVRTLVYGKQVQIDYYITNNGNFVPGTIASNIEGYESVPLGISKAEEYKGNPQNIEAYYYLKTDSNYVKNQNSGATTMVLNLYALQGAGNMDARTYDYLYLRVNTLKNGTKITSMKLIDVDGNVMQDNLLDATGGQAVAGQVMRIDLRQMSEAEREQYLENTRLQIVMDGTEANIQAAFSVDEGYTFEDYLDEDDPNYAYKLHLQPLHIEFNASDVSFHSDGSVSINLSASGAGLHAMDRTGGIDATQYKYMYIYLESGAINDIRFRTSDNAQDPELKVEKQFAAGTGLTRINLEELNKSKPRLMKDLCFNFVIYVSTEITGIWFSNSPTFDPIATPTEADYEIVIGQQAEPVNTSVQAQMNLDGSMEFSGKGEYHFKPITGTKGFNASSLKYLVVDIESGAEHLKELRLRNKENSKASAFTGLKNGWQYGVINEFDSKILENVYFTMVVDGKVKIRSMWFTNEPEMDPQYKALEPEYVEVDLSTGNPYLPQADRSSATSSTKLTVNDNGLVTASGPMNQDVGLYASGYYDEYSNPAQALYIKFGVVNRPTYVVAYTYDMVTTGSTVLADVLTVNIQPGTYNDYVRIDMRDSSFYSSGFSGFLEVNIYSPAQAGSGNGVAFTVDKMMYMGTACPALSPLARTDLSDFVPYDAALLLTARDIPGLNDAWPIGGEGGAQTGDNSMALPVSAVALTSAAAMVVIWRKKKQKVS